MNNFNRKKHWENIYQNKSINEVSWFQPTPTTSLDFVQQFKLPKTAKIIDIGGGDSFFVDHLLDLGYEDITVLDISEEAIRKAKQRLADRAEYVKWIIADIVEFQPTEKYDLWHDRAAFHFLTDKKETDNYIDIVRTNINQAGYLIIGTFSEQGPKKCSGIDIKQYSEQSLKNLLKDSFENIKCTNINHLTPFNTVQNFIFCSFKRL